MIISKTLPLSLCVAAALLGSDKAPDNESSICARHLESPVYNQLARQTWLQGDANLKVTIGQDGTVVHVVTLSGHPLLVEKSEENVRKWTFNEGPERVLELTYEYRLEEPKVYEDPPTRVMFDLPHRIRVVSNFGAPQSTTSQVANP
jgi:TonB-like protein